MHGVTKRAVESFLRIVSSDCRNSGSVCKGSRVSRLLKLDCRPTKGQWSVMSTQDFSTGVRDFSQFNTYQMAKTTISLDEYDVYGFDIDHTLSSYHTSNVFELVHRGFAEFLVEKKGYHKDLLEPFSKWKDFCFRGLIFDIKRGNMLKVGGDGTILRASHGTRFMSVEEIKASYNGGRWNQADQLLNNVDNIGPEGDRDYMIFDNLFDMIGTVIMGRVVDIVDRETGVPPKGYSDHFKKVIEAFGEAYNYFHFATQSGIYFPSVIADPSKYIKPCSDTMKTWLKSLRKGGKAIFFLTSSFSDYASHVLHHSLGEDWKDYFDIGVFRARKPTFFSSGRPFLRIEKNSEKEPVQTLVDGQTYSQGNHGELIKFLSKVTGKENPKVLYFGDSIRSDIFPSRSFAEWDTVAVIDEITVEAVPADEEEGQPDIKRKKLEEEAMLKQQCLSSSVWGSFFHDPRQANKPVLEGEMNTLWGSILRKYATIAVPSVQHVAEMPKDHKFSVFKPDSSTCGFSPQPPRVLQKKP